MARWGGKRNGAGRKRSLPGKGKCRSVSFVMLIQHHRFLTKLAEKYHTTKSGALVMVIEAAKGKS